jgi:hypothetical protein
VDWPRPGAAVQRPGAKFDDIAAGNDLVGDVLPYGLRYVRRDALARLSQAKWVDMP